MALIGLTGQPQFNGRTGIVIGEALTDAAGFMRFPVRLNARANVMFPEADKVDMRVKRGNLIVHDG